MGRGFGVRLEKLKFGVIHNKVSPSKCACLPVGRECELCLPAVGRNARRDVVESLHFFLLRLELFSGQ